MLTDILIILAALLIFVGVVTVFWWDISTRNGLQIEQTTDAPPPPLRPRSVNYQKRGWKVDIVNRSVETYPFTPYWVGIAFKCGEEISTGQCGSLEQAESMIDAEIERREQ